MSVIAPLPDDYFLDVSAMRAKSVEFFVLDSSNDHDLALTF
jgi:hypothetical protein